jgi:sarcosine oxidase
MGFAKKFDAIVLGLGGMGSSACYHLSKRGLDVLGVEQFSIPHQNGSSHGQTRMIRKAYFEHPDYVPLLRRSYELWRELEIECGEDIFDQRGMILYADETSTVYQGTLKSSKQHNLPVEHVELSDARKRWPAYQFAEHHSVLFEKDAGFLYPEKAITNFVSLAGKSGAVIKENEPVAEYSFDEKGVIIKTKNNTYSAGKLVITAGAWTTSLLNDLNIPFTLLRKYLSWHSAGPQHQADSNIPCAFYDLGDHMFYMFPSIDEKGVKIGKHSGGEEIQHPEQKNTEKLPGSFLKPLRQFVESYLPNVLAVPDDFVTCMYTNTPDENFIIDKHPESDNLVFAAGFSGHGFKFVPVIGEVLADLVVNGDSELLTDFLKLREF